MENITYLVENGNGDVSGAGMSLEQARSAAQREADTTGQARYVVSCDPEDHSSESFEAAVGVWLVLLVDVSLDRATVSGVLPYDGQPVRGAYALVRGEAPEIGERVWRREPRGQYVVAHECTLSGYTGAE